VHRADWTGHRMGEAAQTQLQREASVFLLIAILSQRLDRLGFAQRSLRL